MRVAAAVKAGDDEANGRLVAVAETLLAHGANVSEVDGIKLLPVQICMNRHEASRARSLSPLQQRLQQLGRLAGTTAGRVLGHAAGAVSGCGTEPGAVRSRGSGSLTIVSARSRQTQQQQAPELTPGLPRDDRTPPS